MVENVKNAGGGCMDEMPMPGYLLPNPQFLMRTPSLQRGASCFWRDSIRFLTIGFGVAISAGLATAATWTGGGANWSSNGNPGWNGTGVPNSAGAIADFTTNGNSGFTVALDQTVILGSLSYAGSGNGSLSFTLTNSLTLNNSGAGASIRNLSTGTGSRVSFGSGSIILADQLTISNTNASITGTQSVLTGGSTVLSGSGNLTIANVSNSLTDGVIHLGGTSTFSGSVLIEKGAVTYASATTGLGNSANSITLGRAGQGSASLISTASGGAATLANNLTVAASTGGTLLLGSTGTGAFNSTYSGTVTLNGNLSVTSARPSGNDVRFTNVISGVGSLRTEGAGAISLRAVNTYSGDTVLNGGAFTLANTGGLKFVIGANGVNNKVYGLGNQTAVFDGSFTFDLSGASPVGSWILVDVSTLNATFGSTFTVVGFTESANVWTRVESGTTYSFSELTGVLTAIPEPSTTLLLGLGLLGLVRRFRRQ